LAVDISSVVIQTTQITQSMFQRSRCCHINVLFCTYIDLVPSPIWTRLRWLPGQH